MKYSKPTLDLNQQLEQLRSRGLIFTDEPAAKELLRNISYYRLAGYWWPMQADKSNHLFKPGSTFNNVIAIYNFARELRILVFDAIERIEIAFRAKLTYHLSLELSPWWFEDSSNFKNVVDHTETLFAVDRELNQTKEVFITEHYRKYHSDARRPPSWKTLEVVSLGNISKLYGNLLPSIKAKDTIAAEMGAVNHTYLPSWLQSITQIRNICAHHSRLWNRNLPGRPKLLSKPPYDWIANVPPAVEHFMLYVHLCCIKYLLDRVSTQNCFSQKLKLLFNQYPNIDPKALGMKPDWQSEPLWQK